MSEGTESKEETLSFEEAVKKLSLYADQKLDKAFNDMLHELFREMPEDPIQFMINFLIEYKKEQGDYQPSIDDDEDDDVPRELPKMNVDDAKLSGRGTRRRTGVSAEPMSSADLTDAPTRVIPKSEDDKAHIRAAVKNNFLFTSLDREQMAIVVDAMEPMSFKAGETIIRQGDDGDEFYVLEEGECHCFLNQPGGGQKLVKVYTFGESFGELALMYNCPRAATIKAHTDVKLWAMDRVTFRKVLMNTTSQKRARYEEFLSRVPLLASMDKYERAKVADALIEKTYSDGDLIILAGDENDKNFYILEEGTAVATKLFEGDEKPTEVKRYGPGDYFGELALIADQPRQANVVAVGECRCVSLDRDSFTRLLGPVEDIVKRHTTVYAQVDDQIRKDLERKKSLAT